MLASLFLSYRNIEETDCTGTAARVRGVCATALALAGEDGRR